MLRVEQTRDYERWFKRLHDIRGKASIARQIERMADAGMLVGDWKTVGDGVIEIRIMSSGPGYRIYISMENDRLLLLLIGGDKSSQVKDIDKARKLLKNWRNDHANKHMENGRRT